jgi:hypothetical protein
VARAETHQADKGQGVTGVGPFCKVTSNEHNETNGKAADGSNQPTALYAPPRQKQQVDFRRGGKSGKQLITVKRRALPRARPCARDCVRVSERLVKYQHTHHRKELHSFTDDFELAVTQHHHPLPSKGKSCQNLSSRGCGKFITFGTGWVVGAPCLGATDHERVTGSGNGGLTLLTAKADSSFQREK